MKKPAIATFSAALFFAALVAPASAQTPDFAAADADKDGGVTLAEANSAGLSWNEDLFQSLDADANGALSPEEYANAIRQ